MVVQITDVPVPQCLVFIWVYSETILLPETLDADTAEIALTLSVIPVLVRYLPDTAQSSPQKGRLFVVSKRNGVLRFEL